MDDIQLSKDQISQLKIAFDDFDNDKKGKISTDMIGTIMSMLGYKIPKTSLVEHVAKCDPAGTKHFNFEQFCMFASAFMEEDMDTEAVHQELREAFRLYDKERNGYITTEVFRDILHELDENLTPWELDMIIEEVDADGSGTLDFDEFMTVMTG